MKDAYYFPHDYNAHNDPKLIKLSMSGWDLVGMYWAIIGMLHSEGGWLPNEPETIAFALRVDCKCITTLINFPDLFIFENGLFTSKRVLENLNHRQNIREKRQVSALKRWNNANALQLQCKSNAGKERKGKEKKGKESAVFKKPSLFLVQTFLKERNSPIDPEAFHAFYESKGWKIGNVPMKSWKAAVVTWEKRMKTQEPTNKNPYQI